MTLARLVSFGASQGITVAFSAPTLSVPDDNLDSVADLSPDPAAMKEVLRAGLRSELASVNGMRNGRIAILIGLSLASGLVLVSALRLRWAFGINRVQMAGLLSKSALATTIFRTMDGAQLFATEMRASAARAEVLMTSPALNVGDTVELVTLFSRGFNLLITVGVVFAFFLVWRYFGSEGVAQELARADAAEPRKTEDD